MECNITLLHLVVISPTIFSFINNRNTPVDNDLFWKSKEKSKSTVNLGIILVDISYINIVVIYNNLIIA